jgi:hypothetical protein
MIRSSASDSSLAIIIEAEIERSALVACLEMRVSRCAVVTASACLVTLTAVSY